MKAGWLGEHQHYNSDMTVERALISEEKLAGRKIKNIEKNVVVFKNKNDILILADTHLFIEEHI
ncbi:MAG: hypothetical protein K2K87_09595 [Lachnospiraceae bacterium]|nr:hypothetical protein [Lachnospiraceae bacterium]